MTYLNIVSVSMTVNQFTLASLCTSVYDGEGKDILCWLNVVYTVISNRTSKKKPNILCNNSVHN